MRRPEPGTRGIAASDLDRREGYFAGSGEVRLFYQAWEAAQPSSALLLIHGQGEHSGRYAALAADLVPQGISVYAMDQRGHGRSEGRRGHARRFGELLEDVDRFRALIAAQLTAQLPLFLLGHSFGGLVALRYVQEQPDAPLRGAILSSPLLGLGFAPPAWKTALARVLTRLLPMLRFANEVNAAHISRDADVVVRYREDPLVHSWVTPRMYTEILAAMRQTLEQRDRLRLPLLFLVAGDDRIVAAQTTAEFARGLGGEVELRVFEGFYHECLNEPERHRVVREIVGWIEARTP
ncbi:MAG TPA: alpha/beta hydrolase [Longimicrobiaceae bacterium]|nr:alpha/beta hydrolase [Longimicrobiaceae bacterium]